MPQERPGSDDQLPKIPETEVTPSKLSNGIEGIESRTELYNCLLASKQMCPHQGVKLVIHQDHEYQFLNRKNMIWVTCFSTLQSS